MIFDVFTQTSTITMHVLIYKSHNFPAWTRTYKVPGMRADKKNIPLICIKWIYVPYVSSRHMWLIHQAELFPLYIWWSYVSDTPDRVNSLIHRAAFFPCIEGGIVALRHQVELCPLYIKGFPERLHICLPYVVSLTSPVYVPTWA